MLNRIKEVANNFVEYSKNKEIVIVSHNDTDGITSASIITKCLKRLDRKFELKIVKSLTPEIIYDLPNNKVILFTDLASNSLPYIEEKGFERVFIIDHHEISQEIPKNVSIINPHLHEGDEKICSAGLSYLFAKSISEENKDLANLAVIGIIGDRMESSLSKFNNEIMKDAEVVIKKGIMLYPATRPLNRVLEYSSEPYIPDVTGSSEGVMHLLREVNIEKNSSGKVKSLIELDDEEMTRLVTAIMIRRASKNHNDQIIGNIFLVKHFSKLEDAREISAKINATSRLGEPYSAILFCLEEAKAAKRVEALYVKYKQALIAGLNDVKEMNKIVGKNYVIINARDKVKDTIIGTVISIISSSSVYEDGTILIGMAYDGDKIKISTRLSGRSGRNLRTLLEQVITKVGGEFGGHQAAAGAIIEKEKEQQFVDELKSNLEVEIIKI